MKFLSGFILGCSLIACAAVPVFSYHFYNISRNNFAGTLLGPTAADDVPFSRCAPVNGKQQCVVVFYSDLNALITDYKQTKSDLISCQRGQ
jgi:hypothetical protein